MITKYKNNLFQKKYQRGVTLIEMTVVILVLLILIGVSVFSITGYREWREGTEAAQALRNVYNAQRTYLSENPTVEVSDLTPALIIPYLSQTAANEDGDVVALPTITADGITYTVDVSVSPPVFTNGGAPFDPSGSTDDGLWDVGGS